MKWEKNDLVYTILTYTPDLSQDEIRYTYVSTTRVQTLSLYTCTGGGGAAPPSIRRIEEKI